MRRLLYISPLFPPHTRVGALRPLKFVRHLPANGWIPTVLCDLQAKDPVNWDLVQTIPAEVEVVRDYGPRARRLERKLWPDRLAKPRGESRASQEGDRKNRHNSWDDIEAALQLWCEQPFTDALEVETYTWDVLPSDLKSTINDSIVRELNWVRGRLK